MKRHSRRAVRAIGQFVATLPVFALLVGLFLACSPGVVHAAGQTQYVFSAADRPSTATDCTYPLAGCSLRDALHAAAAGDTVILAPTIFQPFNVPLTVGPLAISQDVTIHGQGLLTVNGGGASRVFTITGGTVSMDGVTITNGRASDSGGGIQLTGGSLTLTDCAVTGNTVIGTGSQLAGGGIYAQSALTLSRTTVSGNTLASTGAGPSSLFGGGIEQVQGTLTVTGSTISGNVVRMGATNTGDHAAGGGIDNKRALVLTNSTVSGNFVIGTQGAVFGGGISDSSPANSTATVTNSTIAGNSATYGGGIFNQALLAIMSSTITGNDAVVQGGGLFGGTDALTDTLIARNTDTVGYPDVVEVGATDASRNNLVGDGDGLSGISDGTNGNQIGNGASPLDPKLDPNGLRANGGTGPQTVALLLNSPAIEAGSGCPSGVTTDERGQPRIAVCDIGAYRVPAGCADGGRCHRPGERRQHHHPRHGFPDRHAGDDRQYIASCRARRRGEQRWHTASAHGADPQRRHHPVRGGQPRQRARRARDAHLSAGGGEPEPK